MSSSDDFCLQAPNSGRHPPDSGAGSSASLPKAFNQLAESCRLSIINENGRLAQGESLSSPLIRLLTFLIHLLPNFWVFRIENVVSSKAIFSLLHYFKVNSIHGVLCVKSFKSKSIWWSVRPQNPRKQRNRRGWQAQGVFENCGSIWFIWWVKCNIKRPASLAAYWFFGQIINESGAVKGEKVAAERIGAHGSGDRWPDCAWLSAANGTLLAEAQSLTQRGRHAGHVVYYLTDLYVLVIHLCSRF